MKFEERLKIVSVAGRILIGFILIYSGILKIIEPLDSFIEAIEAYKIISGNLAVIVAKTLPWFEVYLGVFLVFGLFAKQIVYAALFLFSVFELMLLQAILRGLEIKDCGCFGPKHSNPIWLEFTLNLVWIFLLFVGRKFADLFSLDRFIEKKIK